LSTSGLSSVDTVKADRVHHDGVAVGSASATYLAPPGRRAEPILDDHRMPSVCVIFSARRRAMVSDAAPGVTPEMKRHRLGRKLLRIRRDGNGERQCCGCEPHEHLLIVFAARTARRASLPWRLR